MICRVLVWDFNRANNSSLVVSAAFNYPSSLKRLFISSVAMAL